MKSIYLLVKVVIVSLLLVITASRGTYGQCSSYTEGQYLFTTSWGEAMYAHYYNGILYAAYQDNTNFRPQHWLVATGQMSTAVASCFAENDPHTTSTPPPNPPTGANYAGSLDGADCNQVFGWVLNKNTPNQSIGFDVYINGSLAASNISANGSRQDVADAYGISGYSNFGFGWSIPSQYKNGTALTISVKYAGTNTDIPGSPKTTAVCQGTGNPPPNPPTGANYAGSLDGADCNQVFGWVLNKNTPNQSIGFDVYINGSLAASNISANGSRQDVADANGISGYINFGFGWSIPSQYKNGTALTISVKYAGTNTDIPGSPKTTEVCQGTGNPPTNSTSPINPPYLPNLPRSTSNLIGKLEFANCSNIIGWVLDKNNPTVSQKFDVYVNGQLALANAQTNISRQDIADQNGISTYNTYGFNLNLPSKYMQNVNLTILVKFAGTSTNLNGCVLNP